jgi:hypothetical protein
MDVVNGVPMIELDLNTSALKQYLDSIAGTLNQHASLINSI